MGVFGRWNYVQSAEGSGIMDQKKTAVEVR
jgi:hypothetical protein